MVKPVMFFLMFCTLFIGGCKSELIVNQGTKKDDIQNARTERLSTNTSYKLSADDCTDPNLSKLAAGESFMLCDGSLGVGTYKIPDLSNLIAANVKSDISIIGVIGVYNAEAFNCSTEGEENCVNTGTFKAADTTDLAAKIKTGESVAGEAGSYAPDFPSASNVRDTDTVDNAAGTLADCSTDGETG